MLACTLELLQIWACVSSLFLQHNGLCKIIPKRHNNTSELGDCEAVPVCSVALAQSFSYDWKTNETWIYRKMMLIAAVVLFTLSPQLFSITFAQVSKRFSLYLIIHNYNGTQCQTKFILCNVFFLSQQRRETLAGFSCILAVADITIVKPLIDL